MRAYYNHSLSLTATVVEPRVNNLPAPWCPSTFRKDLFDGEGQTGLRIVGTYRETHLLGLGQADHARKPLLNNGMNQSDMRQSVGRVLD